jgi:hypothetical protein
MYTCIPIRSRGYQYLQRDTPPAMHKLPVYTTSKLLDTLWQLELVSPTTWYAATTRLYS